MNSFGRIFRVSVFGESHGPTLGVILDGIPPGIPLEPHDFSNDIARRHPASRGTTPRREDDVPAIQSGHFNGRTTGAPLMITFGNRNADSSVYDATRHLPRPGHADWTSWVKYAGFNDYRGGGHSSGRLTLVLVAAGVIAKKIIDPVSVSAAITEIGGMQDYEEAIRSAMADGDSVGGIVECRISGVPPGLGEPFFDSLESTISHAVFSIPAVKGIEFGAGFASARMRGSEINDPIVDTKGRTETNNAGGINGGISNGNDIVFRVVIKPASSISRSQRTVNLQSGKQEELAVRGRHDAAIPLRVPVVLEAVASIVIADAVLVRRSQESSGEKNGTEADPKHD